MKKCRICPEKFQPLLPNQVCCSLDCALAYAKAKSAKKARAEVRIRKEKTKTLRDCIKEAQVAFNAYIRERDKDKPCICCGLPLASGSVGGSFDCGHYRSVGSAPNLRFDERNAHGQRKQCNRYGAGRAVDYRLGLIQRIGLESVEAVESDNEPRKWSKEEAQGIKATYKAKLKELRRAGE